MEYRRCQGKSYMIREAEPSGWGYQIPMLRENAVKGILPMERVQEEEKTQFWYEISGKHDLEGYSRFHKLGRKFLENFILSLCRTAGSLGEYLLLEDEICLDPEMIYLNYDEREIFFCYIPGSGKKLDESLGNFMEFFLKHMEHGEQQDIEICYKVYEKSQSEHVDLQELAEIMSREPCFKEQPASLAESAEWREGPKVREEEGQKLQKGQERFRFPCREMFEKRKNFRNLLKRQPKRQKRESEQFVFEPEETVEESSNPTVFLGSESKEIFGELRYEGEGRGRNFKIDVPVFLVGSQEGEANGVIFTSSVSRRHAMIYKEEGNYYIEDLNSTNGTYLNGEALNYKERVPLSKNDKVKFAEEAYRFV